MDENKAKIQEEINKYKLELKTARDRVKELKVAMKAGKLEKEIERLFKKTERVKKYLKVAKMTDEQKKAYKIILNKAFSNMTAFKKFFE